jgi:hypothetical protein
MYIDYNGTPQSKTINSSNKFSPHPHMTKSHVKLVQSISNAIPSDLAGESMDVEVPLPAEEEEDQEEFDPPVQHGEDSYADQRFYHDQAFLKTSHHNSGPSEMYSSPDAPRSHLLEAADEAELKSKAGRVQFTPRVQTMADDDSDDEVVFNDGNRRMWRKPVGSKYSDSIQIIFPIFCIEICCV